MQKEEERTIFEDRSRSPFERFVEAVFVKRENRFSSHLRISDKVFLVR